MDETDRHPLGDQRCLPVDDGFKQCQWLVLRCFKLRIMTRNGIVEQRLQAVLVAPCGKMLKRADAQMACRHPGQHGAGMDLLADNHFTGGGDCQAAGCWDTERVHRLADRIFADHRAKGCTAIATARERRRAGTLELDVEALAVFRHHLAQQRGAAIAQPRIELAELVARIGHGKQPAVISGRGVAGKKISQRLFIEPVEVQSEFIGQRTVQPDELCLAHRRWRHEGVKALRQTGIALLQPQSFYGCGSDIRCFNSSAHGFLLL